MNVLEITNATNLSGGVRQVLILCDGLVKKGHNVILVTSKEAKINKFAKNINLKIEHLETKNDLDILSALKLIKIIKKYSIDVIHAHHPKAHSIAFISSLILKKIVFVFTRRVIYPIPANPLGQMKYKSARVDKIVAVCNAVKDKLVQHGINQDKIEVIYSSTDVNKFNPDKVEKGKILKEFKIDANEKLIMLIGNYSVYKGHLIFLEAVKIANLKNAKFIVVGENTTRSQDLYKVIEKYGINEKVILAGYREDIPDILADAYFTVNPSLYEACSGTIRESMCMGKPVIATNIGGNKELIQDGVTGLLIPPSDSLSLAKAMTKLVENPAIVNELGSKAREFILNNFTTQIMVNKTETLYKELMSKKRQT